MAIPREALRKDIAEAQARAAAKFASIRGLKPEVAARLLRVSAAPRVSRPGVVSLSSAEIIRIRERESAEQQRQIKQQVAAVETAEVSAADLPSRTTTLKAELTKAGFSGKEITEFTTARGVSPQKEFLAMAKLPRAQAAGILLSIGAAQKAGRTSQRVKAFEKILESHSMAVGKQEAAGVELKQRLSRGTIPQPAAQRMVAEFQEKSRQLRATSSLLASERKRVESDIKSATKAIERAERVAAREKRVPVRVAPRERFAPAFGPAVSELRVSAREAAGIEIGVPARPGAVAVIAEPAVRISRMVEAGIGEAGERAFKPPAMVARAAGEFLGERVPSLRFAVRTSPIGRILGEFPQVTEREAGQIGRAYFEVGSVFLPGGVGIARRGIGALAAETPAEAGLAFGFGFGVAAGARGLPSLAKLSRLVLPAKAVKAVAPVGRVVTRAAPSVVTGAFAVYAGAPLITTFGDEAAFERQARRTAASLSAFMLGGRAGEAVSARAAQFFATRPVLPGFRAAAVGGLQRARALFARPKPRAPGKVEFPFKIREDIFVQPSPKGFQKAIFREQQRLLGKPPIRTKLTPEEIMQRKLEIARDIEFGARQRAILRERRGAAKAIEPLVSKRDLEITGLKQFEKVTRLKRLKLSEREAAERSIAPLISKEDLKRFGLKQFEKLTRLKRLQLFEKGAAEKAFPRIPAKERLQLQLKGVEKFGKESILISSERKLAEKALRPLVSRKDIAEFQFREAEELRRINILILEARKRGFEISKAVPTLKPLKTLEQEAIRGEAMAKSLKEFAQSQTLVPVRTKTGMMFMIQRFKVPKKKPKLEDLVIFRPRFKPPVRAAPPVEVEFQTFRPIITPELGRRAELITGVGIRAEPTVRETRLTLPLAALAELQLPKVSLALVQAPARQLKAFQMPFVKQAQVPIQLQIPREVVIPRLAEVEAVFPVTTVRQAQAQAAKVAQVQRLITKQIAVPKFRVPRRIIKPPEILRRFEEFKKPPKEPPPTGFLLPPIVPFGRIPRITKRVSVFDQGFIPFVRKAGRFVPALRFPVTKEVAFAFGAKEVFETPRRTFIVRPVKGRPRRIKAPRLPPFFRRQLRIPKTPSLRALGAFVEKEKFAIRERGEYVGITLKGLQALAMKPRKRKKRPMKGKRKKAKRRKIRAGDFFGF